MPTVRPILRDRLRALRRLLFLCAISGLIALGASELVLRLARERSASLRAALYSSTDPVFLDDVRDVRGLLATTPLSTPPFAVWAGFKLNSQGFRTPEYERAKSSGIYRVVALGDSFTFDSGMVPFESLWHQNVGRQLADHLGRPVEVINLGVSGTGPRFALRLFEIEATQLAADLVLYGLFVGNDLTDERGVGDSALQRYSMTWRLLRRALGLPTFRWNLDPGSAPGGFPIPGYRYDPQLSFSDDATFLLVERRAALVFAADKKSLATSWLTDVVATVTRLDQRVRHAGAHLVVVLIPDRIQLEPDLQARVRLSERAAKGQGFDFEWLQPALLAGLRARDVDTIDLLPAFRRGDGGRPLYRRVDTHWSADGNDLAARSIVDWLVTRDPPLLPASASNAPVVAGTSLVARLALDDAFDGRVGGDRDCRPLPQGRARR